MRTRVLLLVIAGSFEVLPVIAQQTLPKDVNPDSGNRLSLIAGAGEGAALAAALHRHRSAWRHTADLELGDPVVRRVWVHERRSTDATGASL